MENLAYKLDQILVQSSHGEYFDIAKATIFASFLDQLRQYKKETTMHSQDHEYGAKMHRILDQGNHLECAKN